MAILNYTTKIDASKTVGEIQSTLAKKGATSISVDYDTHGEPVALAFLIDVQGAFVNFRLPSNHAGVLKAMARDPKVGNSFKTEAQAGRVAWRIVKDWTEAQLAIIEAGLATLPEVFLPYAVSDDGRTMFQHFEERQKRIATSNAA